MRITNTMMTNRLLTNTNKNLSQLDKMYMQMSSNKKIQMPSDAPIIASRALKFRTVVSETEQYSSNTTQAQSWLEITETTFANMNSILGKMRDLSIQGSTDSLTVDDRGKVMEEFKSLLTDFELQLNSDYMGRHIFSGYKTDTKPIIKDESGNNILNPSIYSGDEGSQDINIEIGVNNYIAINSLSTNVYTQEMYDGMHALDSFYKQIDAGEEVDEKDLRENFSSMITKLDSYMANVAQEHTLVGVKMSRLNLVQERLSEDYINYTSLLSNNEDVNLAEAAMNYNLADATYNAALKVGMSITKASLTDYL